MNFHCTRRCKSGKEYDPLRISVSVLKPKLSYYTHHKVPHVHVLNNILAELLWARRPSHDASLHRTQIKVLLGLDAKHVNEHGGGAIDRCTPEKKSQLKVHQNLEFCTVLFWGKV